jgi:hypothetical protein
MGNKRWLKRRLQEFPAGASIVESGAGDGTMARIAGKSAALSNWIACDLTPQPAAWPSSWQWCQGDL